MSERIFSYLEVHAVDHCNNNCRWCNNHSPFAPVREFLAQEYIPWLELILDRGLDFDMISVMGGEPFLHSDLTRFVLDLKRRFPDKALAISTNGFWLGEEQIRSYAHLWKLTDILFLSLYPNLLKSIRGGQDPEPLIAMLRESNPDMDVQLREKQQFRIIEYPEEPVEPEVFCGTSECTTLLADGRLARCGLGGYAHYNAHVGKAFRESRHMFFDLKREFSLGEFWNWRRRWPFDACFHCTSFRWKMSAWKAEQGTRRRRDLELEHDLLAGKRLLATEQKRDAERLLREVLERGGADPRAYNYLAVSVYERSPAQALEYLAQALDLDPDYSEARDNLRTVRQYMASGARAGTFSIS